MGIWKDEMKRIRKLKKTIYKPPSPRRIQRAIINTQMPGKVKVFSEDEIFLFKIRKYAENTSFN